MHLYQRAYKGKDGERRRAKTWWLVAHVGGERIHVSTGSRDRRAAELIASDIVRRAELKRAGIVDPFEAHEAKSLSAHVKDFVTTLRARNVVARYRKDREDCLHAYLEHSKATRLRDLTLVSASAYVETVAGRGLSARSINRHVQALKQFSRWLLATRRVAYDVLENLKQRSEAEDRRHVRRALTPEEAERLLRTAVERPLREAEVSRIHAGVSEEERVRLLRLGETRALVYAVALATGLRAGEIRRLRWLDVKEDRVEVPAASAKSRRDQSVPLSGRLATMLAAYRPAAVLPTSTVIPRGAFPNILTFHRDLAAAGIARRDDEERVVDFHALRTTFVSWLAAAGAHPRTAQALARHASVETTMSRYTDLRLLDLQATVDRLPLPVGATAKGSGEELRTWDRRGAREA